VLCLHNVTSALKIYFVILKSFSVSFCSCSLSGESSKHSGYLSYMTAFDTFITEKYK